jgi:hypothetical protein
MGQTWMILAVGLDRYCSWKCTSVYRGCDVDRSITARVKRDGAREVDNCTIIIRALLFTTKKFLSKKCKN